MTLISGCPEGKTRMYTCLKFPLYQIVFPLIVSSHYIQFIQKGEWPCSDTFVLPRSFCVNTFPVAFLVS